MPVVMRLVEFVGFVAGPNDPDALPPGGAWLKAYDADAHDGQGFAEWTTNLAEALRFENTAAAHECWRRQSTARPFRWDGQPNRPLSAFSITIEPVDR